MLHIGKQWYIICDILHIKQVITKKSFAFESYLESYYSVFSWACDVSYICTFTTYVTHYVWHNAVSWTNKCLNEWMKYINKPKLTV